MMLQPYRKYDGKQIAASHCGVYEIRHIDSGKKYIGSARDIRRRLKEHRHNLRHGAHFNAYLQRAWNKHGEDAFEMKPVLLCAKEMQYDYEQAVILGFKSVISQFGYNGTDVVVSGNGKREVSKETRAKLSKAHKGKKFSEEHRRSHTKDNQLGIKEFQCLRGQKDI